MSQEPSAFSSLKEGFQSLLGRAKGLMTSSSGDHDALNEAQPLSLIEEIKELAGVVFVALILMIILRTLFFQPYTIPSASMEPNLYEGDYIIVSKWNYGYSKYSSVVTLPFIQGRIFENPAGRGDVVVFKLPYDNKTDYIKRIIGLPGDRVQMRANQLYLNGQPVATQNLGSVNAPSDMGGRDQATLLKENLGTHSHTIQDYIATGDVDDTIEYVVPDRHYFVMGDNRDNSADSRYIASETGVGFVPYENVQGKAIIVLMSWKTGSKLWYPWTWFNLRWDRFFKGLDKPAQ
jgi:signal peptidase I